MAETDTNQGAADQQPRRAMIRFALQQTLELDDGGPVIAAADQGQGVVIRRRLGGVAERGGAVGCHCTDGHRQRRQDGRGPVSGVSNASMGSRHGLNASTHELTASSLKLC